MNKLLKTLYAVILRTSSFGAVLRKNKIRLTRALALVLAVSVLCGCVGEFYTPVVTAAQEASEADADLCKQSFELYPEGKKSDKTVTLNGMMPKDASAQAIDVTEDYTDGDGIKEISSDNPEASILAAYDISIIDGKDEYQPEKDKPIRVEITNPQLDADRAVALWHIKDDGTKEKIKKFKLEDGRITFNATGFSIYAIVDVNEPFNFETAKTLADLTGTRAAQGLCLFYGDGKYFTSSLNSNSALKETTDVEQAAVWYLEAAGNYFKLYTYVSGVKKYIHTKPGNNTNLIELSENAADLIDITQVAQSNNTSFYLRNSEDTRYLQHSGSGGGIRYWPDNNNATNSRIKAAFADSLFLPDDYFGLDGKSYGIMYYPGGTEGNAFMADGSSPNYLSMVSITVRKETRNSTLYVAEDSDISMWTFHWVSDVQYKLSTDVNGETKYLKFNGSTLTMVGENDASVISVSSNKTNNIKLSCNGKSVSFGNSGFVTANTSTDTKQWLNFVEVAGLSNEDYITYSANKVSLSEVPDGTDVIVYTRVWDSDRKQYDFYAIDHDGTLYPCYERGDDIMWVGTQINTLLWNFTEYYNEDGTLNYYYELFNPYSDKYIAPQINGQTLSDNTIGINLPGRRAGEYYSTIVAWDEPYYAYAGLIADTVNGELESGNKADANTFYFALVESPVPTLTAVDTIDNNEFGVTMKMIDFPVQPDPSTGTSFQNDFFGTTSESSLHGIKGLLSTNIDPATGYPTARSGASLGTLYAGATEVNHLFIESIYESSGYFEYDSCQNFATLVKSDGSVGTDFTVYKELGTTNASSKPTLKHGQFFPYNSITAGVYSEKNPENLYSALASMTNANVGLLPDSDPRKYEKLHVLKEAPNYYNGMEMSASLVKTPHGKDNWGHDIIFEFTGDDDFWLYVDGELVIDLGGIHSALEGNVNFSTGEVYVDGVTSTLRQVFENNYRTRNPNATNAEVQTFLAQYFNENSTVFKDYSTHTMKVFYMERGGGASNLHMRFNASYVTPGSVMLTKTVSGSADADFKLAEYPFQIWYIDEATQQERILSNDNNNINVTYQNSVHEVEFQSSYTPPNSNETYSNVYFLNPDMTAEIHFPANTINYKIIECATNTEVYDEVRVNNDIVQSDPLNQNVRKSFDTGWSTVGDRPTVVFDNHVDADALRTLSIQKVLLDKDDNVLSASDDPTTFSFRLYLTNGSDENLELANMHKYYVTDPDGYLCVWNVANQRFTPTSETDYASLSSSDKAQYTYETSMNGAISKIPAGYTVEVPNVPVGTKFMVVERENEIPTGYSFVRYERESGTYHTEDGDTLNSGWVRANESPKMFIYNKRGWGLEVNKVWSDKSFTTSHDNVFAAVYVGNTLVADTVRCLSGSKASTRYYFDDLVPGATFADYTVYEVELVNPVVDSSGNLVSYDSISRRLEDGDLTTINAVPKNSGTTSVFSYGAAYDVGTPISTASNLENVRKDTITNTRTGGVVITLYDMDTDAKLSGGTFTLMQGNTNLGTYVSDSHGRITILYDFERNVNYTLTQTSPPQGYIGLPSSTVFSIGNDDSVSISGNESQWQDGRKSDVTGDQLIAYIDVFNKPFTFTAVKADADSSDVLSGAHFALYKSVNALSGVQVKDSRPMRGYEDLVTGADGIIPGIDNTLPAGKYYLTEVTAPNNYEGLDSDIVFTVSARGVITISDSEHSSLLTTSGTTRITNTLTVPNTFNGIAHLTVTKTVQGNFGNRNKDFTFTLTVAGALPTDEYMWSKNGVAQPSPLHSSSTFTLRHGDSAQIVLPKNASVTVSENNAFYDSSFKLGDSAAQATDTQTFVITDDITLAVTNTLDSLVPTGIFDTAVPTAIIILAVVSAGIVLFVIRKKKYIDNAEDEDENRQQD
jgi:fibro-slime domain-containing protein